MTYPSPPLFPAPATIATRRGPDADGMADSWETENFGDIGHDEARTAKVAQQVVNLIDKLEDYDDVQNVFANADIPDEILEQLSDG